jgi:hypothetical protein
MNSHDFTPIDLNQFLDDIRLIQKAERRVWVTAKGTFISSAYRCHVNLDDPSFAKFAVSDDHFLVLNLTACSISIATYSKGTTIVQLYRLMTETQNLIISTAESFSF